MKNMEDEITIKHSFCSWYDLLGYGKPFIDSNWDLNDDRCKMNIKRIENIKGWFLGGLFLYSKAVNLYINDGVISSIDVDVEQRKSLYSALCFLETIIQAYISLNNVDKRAGFPGVRGVITSGDRFDYECCNTAFDVATEKTIAYYPQEFQMNTAFSKAYIMEGGGTAVGLKGSNLYIDKAVYSLFNAVFVDKQDCRLETKKLDNELSVKVFWENNWFATLTFDAEAIVYNNKGICTELYKMNKIESEIQEMAKEASLQQAIRYSRMEEEDW